MHEQKKLPKDEQHLRGGNGLLKISNEILLIF